MCSTWSYRPHPASTGSVPGSTSKGNLSPQPFRVKKMPCRNKVQAQWSVRMPQLHTSLHFHLTPIVSINGSSRRDLLNSQKLLSLHPRRGREPVAVSAVLPKLWGSRNRESTHLGVGLTTSRCFQQLSAPHLATQRLPWAR
ncbi:hypothetical protein HAX54_034012 [Datura stramonium]|uniref:Uncharacterized protein n=1 Tax=Datura stramonium TaxID=4076 RepID=A0ABS8VEE0_DATST|nr:hypothetical protein [Datura stramonium]